MSKLFQQKRRSAGVPLEKRTVLFVDDDEVTIKSLQRGLLDESYNKLFARSGEEALQILRREKVHVIVTDMNMPEMTGWELLRIVRRDYPDIVGMLLTGYEQDVTLQTLVDQSKIFRLIPKPWKIGELDFEKLVRKAIDHYNIQNAHDLVGK